MEFQMKEAGRFTSKRWGPVQVLVGNYEGTKGPLAVVLISDWSENTGVVVEALASGLFKVREDLEPAASGYIEAAVWELLNPPV
jgi:hypothetical protein